MPSTFSQLHVYQIGLALVNSVVLTGTTWFMTVSRNFVYNSLSHFLFRNFWIARLMQRRLTSFFPTVPGWDTRRISMLESGGWIVQDLVGHNWILSLQISSFASLSYSFSSRMFPQRYIHTQTHTWHTEVITDENNWAWMNIQIQECTESC